MIPEMLKAKTQLLFKQPFFATLVFKLNFKEVSFIHTMDVDTITLRYNPDFVRSITVAETIGVLAHEALHCALGHCMPERIGSRNKAKWNRVCDYAINPLVINAGLSLPEGALIDPQFYDKTVEHIYDLLPDEPMDNEPDQGGIGGIQIPTQEDGSPLSSGELRQLEG